VLIASDLGRIVLAKSRLQSAGILFTVRGEESQGYAGGFISVTPPTGVEFLVRADDADDARLLLKDLAT